jgi:pyruvate/2-oxoglutarate/acetoin dehydrogenase E1 component
MPATVGDARGMLLAALEQPDPVFIMEHATLYPLEGEVDETAGACDIRKAAVRRQGSHVSLITYGACLWKALTASEQLAEKGIEAEVVDLRTLRPLDSETFLASVAKTHGAVIVEEAWKTGGFAAEVSAQIMENVFDVLDWPVQRVCGAEVPAPYAKHMEDASLPQVEDIVGAVEDQLL